jgi:hypothetical protein
MKEKWLMIMPKETLLGIKISSELKMRVTNYCDRNGVKIKSFVAQAIKEKLISIAEDAADNALVDERLERPDFLSEGEMKKYLKKRRKSS